MQASGSTRILRTNQVIHLLGISRVTLWRWERKGLFPPKVRLGPNVVGWKETDLDAWLDSKSQAGAQGDE
ncbi:MAG: AlpA family phage regulatory protein [Deltaproteobacteria bacterium]|nr:AlpA family phage regulatory protein [Deltaproteobacteria bacterium]